MPKIIPIKDLKDTAKLANMVRETAEPVYVTKNGYGEMVIMSMDVYEKTLLLFDVFSKLEEAEHDFAEGHQKDAFAALDELKAKYAL